MLRRETQDEGAVELTLEREREGREGGRGEGERGFSEEKGRMLGKERERERGKERERERGRERERESERGENSVYLQLPHHLPSLHAIEVDDSIRSSRALLIHVRRRVLQDLHVLCCVPPRRRELHGVPHEPLPTHFAAQRCGEVVTRRLRCICAR